MIVLYYHVAQNREIPRKPIDTTNTFSKFSWRPPEINVTDTRNISHVPIPRRGILLFSDIIMTEHFPCSSRCFSAITRRIRGIILYFTFLYSRVTRHNDRVAVPRWPRTRNRFLFERVNTHQFSIFTNLFFKSNMKFKKKNNSYITYAGQLFIYNIYIYI